MAALFLLTGRRLPLAPLWCLRVSLPRDPEHGKALLCTFFPPPAAASLWLGNAEHEGMQRTVLVVEPMRRPTYFSSAQVPFGGPILQKSEEQTQQSSKDTPCAHHKVEFFSFASVCCYGPSVVTLKCLPSFTLL